MAWSKIDSEIYRWINPSTWTLSASLYDFEAVINPLARVWYPEPGAFPERDPVGIAPGGYGNQAPNIFLKIK